MISEVHGRPSSQRRTQEKEKASSYRGARPLSKPAPHLSESPLRLKCGGSCRRKIIAIPLKGKTTEIPPLSAPPKRKIKKYYFSY